MGRPGRVGGGAGVRIDASAVLTVRKIGTLSTSKCRRKKTEGDATRGSNPRMGRDAYQRRREKPEKRETGYGSFKKVSLRSIAWGEAAGFAPWHSVESWHWAQVPVVCIVRVCDYRHLPLMQILATPPFSFHAQPLNCPTRAIKPPRIRLVSHCRLASIAFCLSLPPPPNTSLGICRLRPRRSPLLRSSSPCRT